jgi:hypothetical protein
LPCFVFVVARIDVRERLPVGVAHHIDCRIASASLPSPLSRRSM